MEHLDEGTIHAWLDGALPPDEASGIEAHVASCAECSAAVAEARGFIAASTRILAALDDVPAAGDTGRGAMTQARAPGGEGARAVRAPRRSRWFRPRYAAAAGIAAIAISSMLVARNQGEIMQSSRAADAPAAAAEQGAPVTEGFAVTESTAGAARDAASGARDASPTVASAPTSARPDAPRDSREGIAASSAKRATASESSADRREARMAERKAAAPMVPIAPPPPAPAPAPARALSDSAPKAMARALREEATAQRSEVRDLAARADSASRRGGQPQRLSPAIRPDELARNERDRIAGEPKVMNAESAVGATASTEALVAAIAGCWRFTSNRSGTTSAQLLEVELSARGVSASDAGRRIATPIGETATRMPDARDWEWWIDSVKRAVTVTRRIADVIVDAEIPLDWLVPRATTSRATRIPCPQR